jgi:hypothetical protein
VKLPRLRADHFLAGVFIASLLAVAAALAPDAGSAGPGTSRSSHDTGASGLRGLLLAARDLGIPAAPHHGSLERLDAALPALVAAGPGTAKDEPLGPLEAWVRGGGRLLLAGAPGDAGAAALFRLEPVTVEESAVVAGPAGDALGIPADAGRSRGAFAAAPDGAEVLLTVRAPVGDLPFAVAFRHGEGEVIAVADAALLSNGSLGIRGGAVAALRMVERVAGDGPVFFAESLHGYREGGSPFGALGRLSVGTPAGRAALGAAAFCLLGLACGAGRLGRIRRRLAPPRRAEAEFLDATAGMLSHASAWREAGELLLHGYRRRLHLPARPTTPAAAAEVAAALSWDRPSEAGALAAAAEELLEPAGPAGLLRSTAALDAAMEGRDARVRRRIG